MKPKRLLFSALMLFAVLNSAKAQLEQEIEAFVDSTEILVIDGREMMLQYVQAGNFERIAEIFEFLNERTQAYDCNAFTYQESLYIALLINNWNDFLTRAERFSETTRIPLCVPLRDRQLVNALYAQLQNDALWLSNNVLVAGLTIEEKDLLQLFFHVLKHGVDETYNRKLRIFRREYPQSRFNDFIRNYLPDIFIGGGMGFGIGASQIFPTGGLSNFFAPATAFNMTFDVNYSDFIFGFHLDYGSMRLNRPLLISKTNFDYDFLGNERFRYFDFGFHAGYTLFRNNWFEFLPFINMSGTRLRSNLFDAEYLDDEFKVINSFTVGSGLRSEFRLLNSSDGFFFRSVSLRLEAGYNIPVSFRFRYARGNIFYTRIALVRRIRDF